MPIPFRVPRITLLLALLVFVPAGAFAQDTDGATTAGEAVMALDGTSADIEAPTAWHTCDVVRTGAGWGNHYVALTCPAGPFTNKWHIMNDAQKDAMLATALSAAASDNKVQVYIQAASGGSSYNEIRALYLHK